MRFIVIYEYILTYRPAFSVTSTRESKNQIGMALLTPMCFCSERPRGKEILQCMFKRWPHLFGLASPTRVPLWFSVLLMQTMGGVSYSRLVC